jgi:hypothetical protein
VSALRYAESVELPLLQPVRPENMTTAGEHLSEDATR